MAAMGLGGVSPAVAQDKVETLNLAVASPVVAYGAVWVAMSEGLFEKNGVKVNLVNFNALTTGPALLVSGGADVLASASFLGLRIGLQGKSLANVFNLADMSGRGNALVSKPSIKSMEQLAAMGSNCRVLSTTAGTAGWAIYQGIAAHYKLNCTVSTAGTVALVLAGASSGQYDAAMLNPQDAYAARDAGKVNVLLDPLTMSDATANALYPYHHPILTVFGIRENLAAKREAMTRFVKALRQSNEIIARSSPQQLAAISARLPDVFGSTPASALTLQWQLLKANTGGTGHISEAEWSNLVAAAPIAWGFANLNPNEPALKYSSAVDMRYFDGAK